MRSRISSSLNLCLLAFGLSAALTGCIDEISRDQNGIDQRRDGGADSGPRIINFWEIVPGGDLDYTVDERMNNDRLDAGSNVDSALPQDSGVPGDSGTVEPDNYVATPALEDSLYASCSTSLTDGLSRQLITELRCLSATASLVEVSGLNLASSAVYPWLQAGAANSLRRAIANTSGTVTITSMFRTLAQQYLLYRWAQQDRCGIALAAAPGASNHASGLALDISEYARVRPALEALGWEWLGNSDPVHFDFTGGGIDLRDSSVLAFQRLWNRANPNDTIAEDSIYGSQTAARLGRSPRGGFNPKYLCDPNL